MTMKDVVRAVIGEYNILINDDGSVIQGISGVDWQWLGALFLFGVVLYSFFRIVSKLIGR